MNTLETFFNTSNFSQFKIYLNSTCPPEEKQRFFIYFLSPGTHLMTNERSLDMSMNFLKEIKKSKFEPVWVPIFKLTSQHFLAADLFSLFFEEYPHIKDSAELMDLALHLCMKNTRDADVVINVLFTSDYLMQNFSVNKGQALVYATTNINFSDILLEYLLIISIEPPTENVLKLTTLSSMSNHRNCTKNIKVILKYMYKHYIKLSTKTTTLLLKYTNKIHNDNVQKETFLILIKYVGDMKIKITQDALKELIKAKEDDEVFHSILDNHNEISQDNLNLIFRKAKSDVLRNRIFNMGVKEEKAVVTQRYHEKHIYKKQKVNTKKPSLLDLPPEAIREISKFLNPVQVYILACTSTLLASNLTTTPPTISLGDDISVNNFQLYKNYALKYKSDDPYEFINDKNMKLIRFAEAMQVYAEEIITPLLHNSTKSWSNLTMDILNIDQTTFENKIIYQWVDDVQSLVEKINEALPTYVAKNVVELIEHSLAIAIGDYEPWLQNVVMTLLDLVRGFVDTIANMTTNEQSNYLRYTLTIVPRIKNIATNVGNDNYLDEYSYLVYILHDQRIGDAEITQSLATMTPKELYDS